MCIRAVEHQAATNDKVSSLPFLPAAAAVKQEQSSESSQIDYSRCPEPETPNKKNKVEADNYDDWLNDVMY